MQALERLIDADAFLTLERLPEYVDREYELIDGEMIEMPAPGGKHGKFVLMLSGYIFMYLLQNDVGEGMTENGFHSELDARLVLRPDVAFIRHARAPKPLPDGLIPRMPDLAVEVASPGNTVAELREKAQIYLRNETRMVWLVFPKSQIVEVHRQDGGFEELGAFDTLSGGDVLPGFSLDLSKLFS